jgi:hypothetical protein
MSNSLAIATVTAVLETRLTALINRSGLSGFDVFTDHPVSSDPKPGIYIRLYRMAPSNALRNMDLPTRRSDGSLAQRPRVAIGLHYMLSFVGERATYDAERLAGLVLTDLHAQPYITSEAVQDYLDGLASNHVLVKSDLAEQLEPVKLTPVVLDVDDLSRVWGLYNQSFFALSQAYEASVVLMEPDLRPKVSLPVSETGVHVIPLTAPQLTRVRPQVGAEQPVVRVADTLVVDGRALRGPTTWLRVGERLVRLPEAQVASDSVRVPLAPLDLPAGVHAVQVVHRLDLGSGTDPFRTTAESNVLPVALAPTLTLHDPAAVTPSPGKTEVWLDLAPLPAPEQEVELVLDRLTGGTGRESTRTWRRDTASGAIVFTVPATLGAGKWLVRVRVDGAMSLPELDGTGAYATPAVNVP